MVKIQAQAGNSLADIYDVRGSIAGIDQLESRELPIVHEVGGTVFSERLATATRRIIGPATAQSTNIDVVVTDLPAEVTRLLNIAVYTDVVARINDLTISVRNPDIGVGGQETPIWIFNGDSETARLFDAGVEVTRDFMTTMLIGTPTFMGGRGQDNSNMMQDIVMRGTTTAFGAGTVFCIALLYFAVPFILGTNSRGLPVPSW